MLVGTVIESSSSVFVREPDVSTTPRSCKNCSKGPMKKGDNSSDPGRDIKKTLVLLEQTYLDTCIFYD